MTQLHLYNTRTREKALFVPEDPANVRLYACGPTVYDRAHIGNARPIIVFDVLFRLLRAVYGDDHVTYVRNVTDVDDKINKRAAERGITIAELTETTLAELLEDVADLGCLDPTYQPRATKFIAEMRELIEALVARDHAYVAADHVLFSVSSMAGYGALSRRSVDEMIAGARVDVAPYKRDAMDFVLWKPSKAGEPSWPSPCDIPVEGRPGWHIECSAMSRAHLGDRFDIHAGGIDLVFPHHENERAQTMCSLGVSEMATVWMHNGFLQVEGRKMSKSEGNFITIRDALSKERGAVLRLAMLMTQYRQPIDWTAARIEEAKQILSRWTDAAARAPTTSETPDEAVVSALADDLNTPAVVARLNVVARNAPEALAASAGLLGLDLAAEAAAKEAAQTADGDAPEIQALVDARLIAKAERQFAEADRIRDTLAGMGVTLKDGKDPTGAPVTEWSRA